MEPHHTTVTYKDLDFEIYLHFELGNIAIKVISPRTGHYVNEYCSSCSDIGHLVEKLYVEECPDVFWFILIPYEIE